MTAPHFRSWAVSHPGTKRKHNEDAYVDRPDLGVWAVADGAGGHQAGEVASGHDRRSTGSDYTRPVSLRNFWPKYGWRSNARMRLA